MSSLLGKSLFEVSGQGPPPNKDFFQFSVTKTEVIWRWWKISLRSDGRNTKPGELRESHNDYLDDSRIQTIIMSHPPLSSLHWCDGFLGQVSVVFGPRILQYSQALCQGHYDYLERLPDPLLLHILTHLELEDVARLGHTSHRFRKLCRSEEFWEQAVRGHCGSVSAEVEALALELGWKSVFFTSKLQLQKQISRRRKRSQKLLCTDLERYDVDTMVERSEDPESHAADIEPGSESDPGPEQLCTDMQRCGMIAGQGRGVAQGDCSADSGSSLK
ncbi:F-box only protein 36b isoform X1 [Salmo salar]|uniref:F-box only protein 36b isoform X1 n=1 Tax=Salmo salar TaxID=8030 RepID=A0ABM3EH88_SALSA|nr:F-box only protein 36b isoform X1 [Salmo salar]